MKGNPEERAARLAEYILETGAPVRGAAMQLGISKRPVNKAHTSRLRRLNPARARQGRTVLAKNKAERHLRGGDATRRKYHPDSV